jgi:pyruvate dehydrogenase E2 component (dihydrolipoamide acetyltransferase)
MTVTKVIMPRYGWTMTEGKIIEWLKKEGDYVKKGEPLLTIETEKVQIEVESEASGILRKIIAKEGSVVPVTNLIAIIADPTDDISQIELETRAEAHKLVELEGIIEKPILEEKPSIEEKIKIMPLARRLAEQYGIDIRQIRGTGPDGSITRRDVMQAIEQSKAKPPSPAVAVARPPGRPFTFTTRRKFISERMAQSSRTAARVTITTEADVSEATQILAEMRKQHPEVTYTDFVARAVVIALKENPLLNSVWIGDEVYIVDDINLGIAVASDEGLVVPVIPNADRKMIPELAKTRQEVVSRAREGKALPQDFIGGTFTITNLGMFGVDYFTPIINPPENAILGIGKVSEKPTVFEGKIQVRTLMPLSLSFDHRVIDGAPAAIFLKRAKELLENPSLLI